MEEAISSSFSITMRFCYSLFLGIFIAGMSLLAQETQEAPSNLVEARETLQQSLSALRSTYTADIEFDVPDLAELETKPTISYKQRVFEDGNGDIQADLDHIPLPEDAPAELKDFSFGFLHTAEGNALRLENEAVMRDGQGDEEDPIAKMLNSLNEIPVPSDEELAAMDLQQETEVIDGVECRVLSWIPEEYKADDPKSVAMHCVAVGAEDHLLRSYTALNDKGEAMFSLRFKNVNTNPSFGPDDFTLSPEVKVTHVDNDKDFEMEVQKLFMKKFIQTAIKPKSKRRRRTTSSPQAAVVPQQPLEEPELPAPPPKSPQDDLPLPPPPATPRVFSGKLALCIGLLLALLITGILIYLQKRRKT